MMTATWPAAWARIGRQLYLSRQRLDEWPYKLSKLARKSARDPWIPALDRISRARRQHASSHLDWHKKLDTIRRADNLRQRGRR